MKVIGNIGLKLMVLLIPFFFACPIVMTNYPMRFFDGEYAWYLENKEFSHDSEENARVLIMGDSVAKASCLPDELSADTYNYALGGRRQLRNIII